jgi:hypothetical protein
VSISPTFYARLIRAKVSCADFLYLPFRFVLFGARISMLKAMRKMLVKLTTVHPESYGVAAKIIQLEKFDLTQIGTPGTIKTA